MSTPVSFTVPSNAPEREPFFPPEPIAARVAECSVAKLRSYFPIWERDGNAEVRDGVRCYRAATLRTVPSVRQPDRLYAIRNRATGAIKIGISYDPRKRLLALQSLTADPLELLAAKSGGRKEESRLHRRFVVARLGGEWFRPTLKVLRWVERLAQ